MADETTTQSPAPIPSAVGPGAAPEPQITSWTPALEGATRDEIITILNPLTVDFEGRVGVTQNAMMPVRINNPQGFPTNSESALAAKGISGFRNPDLKGGRVHIANKVTIPAGQTVRQPGDVAQVLVKQLVTAILSIRGEKMKIADAEARRKVEDEIIIHRQAMSDLFGSAGGPVSVEEQLRQAVERANQENTAEEVFPQLKAEQAQPELDRLDKRTRAYKDAVAQESK